MASRYFASGKTERAYRAQSLEKRVRRATVWYWSLAAGKLLGLVVAGAAYMTTGHWVWGILTPVLLVGLMAWLYLRFGGERFYAPDGILRRLIHNDSAAGKR
jgi:hypothetical protein